MSGEKFDSELLDLLTLDDDPIITELVQSDVFTADEDEETRHRLYMSDLSFVLNLPGGEGLRVLRWWVDAAGNNDRTFIANSNIYKNAALADYTKDRLAEICASDPKAYVRLLLEGARAWTRDAAKSHKEKK